MQGRAGAETPLLIIGASARAAAFSALRAGFQPRCADLFADADLQAHVPVLRVPSSCYPDCFLETARREPPCPWMYTGGLENHPGLVQAIARLRPLWGNDADALELARSPVRVAGVLQAAGVPCPMARFPDDPPDSGRWLVKSTRGAGGSSVRFWDGDDLRTSLEAYLQEWIEGDAYAAIYVADGRRSELLGVTQQLVGESWLHARPFHYCGSIGPMDLAPLAKQMFERLGNALAAGCRLRGLFGVDCILRDSIPWPVEINPRYTASVEVLEYATGLRALARHRAAFDARAPAAGPGTKPGPSQVIGKAILFAHAPLALPEEGPWRPTLDARGNPADMPAFADIPRAGERIKAGRPVVTFFARAGSPAACLEALRQSATDLDRRLLGK